LNQKIAHLFFHLAQKERDVIIVRHRVEDKANRKEGRKQASWLIRWIIGWLDGQQRSKLINCLVRILNGSVFNKKRFRN